MEIWNILSRYQMDINSGWPLRPSEGKEGQKKNGAMNYWRERSCINNDELHEEVVTERER